MIDGSAVERVAELAREGQSVEQLTHQIGAHTFASVQLHHLPPKKEPVPPTLGLSSLQAFVDHLLANRDGLVVEDLVVHVEGPTSVALLGPLTGEARQRFAYTRATCEDLMAGFLDRYHPQETFVTALQSRFVQDDDTAALLKLVGRIKLEAGVESLDDGRTQVASTKTGTHLADDVEVPNPVVLMPYRTFREVDQPAIPLVLRVSKDRGVGLWEADGGAWKIEAVADVAEWIRLGIGSDIPVLS